MIDYEKLYLKAMNRIVELEALLEWHPASEPPKDGKDAYKIILRRNSTNGSESMKIMMWSNMWADTEFGYGDIPIDWRDLPPQPKPKREPCPPNAPECEGNPPYVTPPDVLVAMDDKQQQGQERK